MQEERNVMLRRGSARARAALGEQGFSRLHDFTLKRFGGKGLVKSEVW